MARDLPNPLGAVTDALETLLGRFLCMWRPCRWGPHILYKRQWDARWGHNVWRATFTCVRCGRKRTIRASLVQKFMKRHNVWENYRG